MPSLIILTFCLLRDMGKLCSRRASASLFSPTMTRIWEMFAIARRCIEYVRTSSPKKGEERSKREGEREGWRFTFGGLSWWAQWWFIIEVVSGSCWKFDWIFQAFTAETTMNSERRKKKILWGKNSILNFFFFEKESINAREKRLDLFSFLHRFSLSLLDNTENWNDINLVRHTCCRDAKSSPRFISTNKCVCVCVSRHVWRASLLPLSAQGDTIK